MNKLTNCFDYIDSFKKYKKIESHCIVDSIINRNFAPLITIAIPTYNRPITLRETIYSAINQVDFFNYEILILDNDPIINLNTQTIDIVSSFDSDKIRYYKNDKNIGMFGNWNRCIELANGNWIILLHDDDLISPDYLKIISDMMQTNSDMELLYSRYVTFKKNGIHKSITTKLQNILDKIFKLDNKKIQLVMSDFFWGNPIPPSGACFLKKTAIEIGGFNEEFWPNADMIFWCNYYNAIHKKALYLNKELVFYRIEDNESSKKTTKLNFIKNDYYFRMLLINKFLKFKLFYKIILPYYTYFQFNKYNKSLNENEKIEYSFLFLLLNNHNKKSIFMIYFSELIHIVNIFLKKFLLQKT